MGNNRLPNVQCLLFLLIAVFLGGYTQSYATGHQPAKKVQNSLKKGDTLRIAIYRGKASCDHCSETIKSAIEKIGISSQIDFVGPDEDIDITDNTLSHYDIYVQPGGGQNINAAYNSLGDDRAEAIYNYVTNGGRYLGLCMGAYLAEVSYIGLVDQELDSEVGRPGFPVETIDDASVVVNWGSRKENIFYQDGPYLSSNRNDKKFSAIATYENGDLAAARYSCGNGLVVLTGPHPEADRSWFEDADIPFEKMPSQDLFKDLIYSFYQ